MLKPDEKLEKSLNSIGIYTLDGAEIPGTNMLGVEIELPINAIEGFEPPKFSVRTVSPRGIAITFGEWETVIRADDNGTEHALLRFKAFMPLPEGIKPSVSRYMVACSFVDLCWNCGIEPVTDKAPAVDYPIQVGAQYADLGWYMPGRMVDHLVDALGRLNDTFLDGALQDGMLYGTLKR